MSACVPVQGMEEEEEDEFEQAEDWDEDFRIEEDADNWDQAEEGASREGAGREGSRTEEDTSIEFE